MSENYIITDNVQSELRALKKGDKLDGGARQKSAIIDRSDLPKKLQKKMASPSVANVRQGAPRFYHPLFEASNIMLPRDRRERNEWCRHFYRVEPIVATALDLHTEFPISDFSNSCPDDYIKDFFDYVAFDKLDMVNLLLDIGLEYWKIGDVIPYGQLNESEGVWERFVILNPDYINIQSSILADEVHIELIPDEELKAIVAGGPRGQYAEIYSHLSDDVIRYVKMNKNIPLDPKLVSHIAHKASPYETWGTPLMMRCFKSLIYKDKLRDAQNAIANRHITPLRIFKIGQPGEPMPSQDDLDAFRDVLMMAEEDPNFVLVYHYGLQTDYVGSSGKILPLNTEFDFIEKELLNGLGISNSILSGEGYQGAQTSYDAIAKRYMSYRLRLQSWIRNKVYKPLAELHGFYKPVKSEINGQYRIKQREKKLMIPSITWQQQDLSSNQMILSFIQQLQQKGLVSARTCLNIAGLDYETEKKNLEDERGTILDINSPINPVVPANSSKNDSSKPKKKNQLDKETIDEMIDEEMNPTNTDKKEPIKAPQIDDNKKVIKPKVLDIDVDKVIREKDKKQKDEKNNVEIDESTNKENKNNPKVKDISVDKILNTEFDSSEVKNKLRLLETDVDKLLKKK